MPQGGYRYPPCTPVKSFFDYRNFNYDISRYVYLYDIMSKLFNEPSSNLYDLFVSKNSVTVKLAVTLFSYYFLFFSISSHIFVQYLNFKIMSVKSFFEYAPLPYGVGSNNWLSLF